MDMHVLANRVMLTEMTAGGLLKGDVDEMLKVRREAARVLIPTQARPGERRFP